MERRQFHRGILIGEVIGLLLAAVLFVYLLAFEPGGFRVGFHTGIGAAMIGIILGAILGWAFSRPRPSMEEVLGVHRVHPSGISNIFMWVAGAMAVVLAVGMGIEGKLVGALGWLALAITWLLLASGAAERARALLYVSGSVFVIGLLSVGTAFFIGEL
jgi:hypothetical protein